MRQLFAFILRYHFAFLCLLLEVISIGLYINFNNYQRASFINSSNRITGSVMKRVNGVYEYFSLREVNRQLANENAFLKLRLKESYLFTDTATYVYRDSLFRYIPARVLSKTTNRPNNYFLLDKGSLQGIRKDMGVVSPEGVVGIVVNVTEHFSSVMTALHHKYKVNAMIMKNGHIGSVEWNGLGHRTGTLIDIPKHVDLQPGDTIITSGNSLVFPRGIMVGTVDKVRPAANEKFKKADIQFSVDYNKVMYVYVIQSLLKKELTGLENTFENE